MGLEYKDGDIGVYFPVDGKLSEEFCRVNDLVRRKDENGNPASIKGDFNDEEDLASLIGKENFSLVSKHVDLIEKELEHIHTTLSDPNNKDWEKEFYQ